MATCLKQIAFAVDGDVYTATDIQGAWPDPAVGCPNGVLLSASEYAQFQTLVAAGPAAPPPVPALNALTLTVEQGVIVSSAIAGVWMVAWAFRRFNEALGTDDHS